MKHKRTHPTKAARHHRRDRADRRHAGSVPKPLRGIGTDGTFRIHLALPEETAETSAEPVVGIIEKHAR